MAPKNSAKKVRRSHRKPYSELCDRQKRRRIADALAELYEEVELEQLQETNSKEEKEDKPVELQDVSNSKEEEKDKGGDGRGHTSELIHDKLKSLVPDIIKQLDELKSTRDKVKPMLDELKSMSDELKSMSDELKSTTESNKKLREELEELTFAIKNQAA